MKSFVSKLHTRPLQISLKKTAGVVKLVDTLDLGSSAARRGGSSPSTRTKEDGGMKSLSRSIDKEGLAESPSTDTTTLKGSTASLISRSDTNVIQILFEY